MNICDNVHVHDNKCTATAAKMPKFCKYQTKTTRHAQTNRHKNIKHITFTSGNSIGYSSAKRSSLKH